MKGLVILRMDRCINSSESIKEAFWGSALGFAEGAIIFLIGVITLLHTGFRDSFSVVMCVSLILLGMLFFPVFTFLYAVASREFTMDTDGVTIRYLKKFYRHYTWNEVSSITVCDINHASKNASRYDLVIRIVIGDEKYGPYSETKKWAFLSGYEHWRTSEYGIRHFKNIISLSYSPERFYATQSSWGKIIDDKRTLEVANNKTGDGSLS